MSEWQTIDTAKREEYTVILVANAGAWSKPAAWYDGYQGSESGWAEDEIYAAKGEFLSPTHWRPIPDPPGDEK